MCPLDLILDQNDYRNQHSLMFQGLRLLKPQADAGFAISFGRDVDPCVLVIDQCPEGIAIISLAGQHLGFLRQGAEQIHCGVSIPGLASVDCWPGIMGFSIWHTGCQNQKFRSAQ